MTLDALTALANGLNLCFGFCQWSTFRFFGRRRISELSDCRHHGKGEHGHGNVTMPAMPRSALVVIEP